MVTAKLPYKTLGGIVPCPGGWLIVPARLAGVTVNAEEPEVVRQLIDVLEYKPKFDAAAIYAPVGFYEQPRGPYRPCDTEAREMIGWPRVVGVKPMPSRAVLRAKTRDEARVLEPWLTNDDFRRFKWWREAEREFQPFHQRTFFAPSAHELSEPRTLLKYDLEISGFGSQALGHVCLLNLKDHYEVEGLDVDPGMLTVARERLGGTPLHEASMVDFELGTRCVWPLP